jgi:hypothetical protein
LAKITEGLVLEEFEGTLMQADEAARVAREELNRTPKPQVTRPGTRPADLKRYLAPLLKQRDDLVLIGGDTLVIRPVRHILRGALFAQTRNKYRFSISRYIAPLYDHPQTGGSYADPDYERFLYVWEPHFEPLLMDVLAEDIFAHVGSITSLTHLAAEGADSSQGWVKPVLALVLAGERDRAEQYLRPLEQEGAVAKWWLAQQRTFLQGRIDHMCQNLHDRETQAAKALKLGEAWEPSPFPVELPLVERESRSGEPSFVLEPWIARPASLLADVPDQPGDLCFAKDRLHRNNRIMLVAPLNRDEAEIRHRDREPYVLAACLRDGPLVVARHTGGRDRHEPADSFCSEIMRLYLELSGSTDRAYISCAVNSDQQSITLRSFEVYKRTTGVSVWHCSIGTNDRTIIIHDDRTARKTVIQRALTAEDRAIVMTRTPQFGEFEGVAMRGLAWLQRAGYGDFE